MGEFVKIQQQRLLSLLPIAGIVLVAGLLSLAPEKGKAQGAGSSSSDTIPAQLRIHYEAMLSHTTIDSDSQSKETQHQSLDLFATFEVPNIDYRAKDRRGREIPYMFRYENGQLAGPISGGERKGQSTLISMSGNATLSYEGSMSSNVGSSQYSEQGSGDIHAEDGYFSIYILGDKVQVLAHSGPFLVTGQSTDSVIGSRPISEKHGGVSSLNFSLFGDKNDPAWSVSTSWTGGGWTGNAEYVTNSSSSRGDSQALYKVNFTLDLSGKEPVEAVIIPPDNYSDWLPEAGNDEDSPGNTITIKVKLQKKGQPGKKPLQRTAKFKFELTDVSREPGVCLNWPPPDRIKQPPDFDLQIKPDQNPEIHYFKGTIAEDGQSAETRKGLQESSITVTSFDWGAFGKLKVTAILDDDGWPVSAHIQDKPGVETLKIPRDENDNHIADAWEDGYNLSSTDETSDDDDDPPGNGTAGDGLSLYEEYRGFFVANEGGHIRTDPTKKDLFVVNWNNLPMELFAESGLTVHLVKKSETAIDEEGKDPNPWIINFNYDDDTHAGSEHVLWLADEHLDNGTVGETGDMLTGTPGPPKTITAALVRVDRAQCLKTKWGQAKLMSTVAHELAHACNVWHHGLSGYTAACVRLQGQRGPDYGKEVYEVSIQGDVISGDHDCIMRYTYGADLSQVPNGQEQGQPLSWVEAKTAKFGKGRIILCPSPDNAKANWRWGDTYTRNPQQDLPEKPGTTFCATKAGVPFPKAGDASWGNCKKQFCVNDVTGCNGTSAGGSQ